jgi:hypothetical protein
VASRVALDLLYWAMRSASYRLIRMAIETTREETRSELFWGETGLKIRQTCFVTTIVNSSLNSYLFIGGMNTRYGENSQVVRSR